MGLSDTLNFYQTTPVTCAAGHPVFKFQTKSFDCDMTDYFVAVDRLYQQTAIDTLTREELNQQTLVHWAGTTYAFRAGFTGDVEVYTFCDKCQPVVFVSGNSPWGDMFRENSPWVEWTLTFDQGVVKAAKATKNQTREDIKKELVSAGEYVPADDDPLVLRHLKLKQSKRK